MIITNMTFYKIKESIEDNDYHLVTASVVRDAMKYKGDYALSDALKKITEAAEKGKTEVFLQTEFANNEDDLVNLSEKIANLGFETHTKIYCFTIKVSW